MQSTVIKAEKVISLFNTMYYCVNLYADEPLTQWYKFIEHQEAKPVDECGVFSIVRITSAFVIELDKHINDESPYSANIHIHKNSKGFECVDKIELYEKMYAVDIKPNEDYSWLSKYTDKYTFYKKINPLGLNWMFAMSTEGKTDEIKLIAIKESDDCAESKMEIQDNNTVYTHGDIVTELDSLLKQGCYYEVKYVMILNNGHTIKYIA